ncbi:MAG: hypothetical protein U1F98_06285 [Verrucomicrobiota bacterium]
MQTPPIEITLPVETAEHLAAVAKAEGVTVSDIICRSVQRQRNLYEAAMSGELVARSTDDLECMPAVHVKDGRYIFDDGKGYLRELTKAQAALEVATILESDGCDSDGLVDFLRALASN